MHILTQGWQKRTTSIKEHFNKLMVEVHVGMAVQKSMNKAQVVG